MQYSKVMKQPSLRCNAGRELSSRFRAKSTEEWRFDIFFMGMVVDSFGHEARSSFVPQIFFFFFSETLRLAQ